MTTGSYGLLPPASYDPVVASPQASYKTWSGLNGKTEVFSGSLRTKWNPYSMEARSLLGSAAPIVLRGKGSPGTAYAGKDVTWNFGGGRTLIGRLGLNNSIDSYLQNQAFQKLLSRIKGHDFDLGVNIGQMGQTVNLLAGTLGSLGRAALALKRGDFASAARQLGARPRPSKLEAKDVSGRWLELQYGWLPLISDSFEAAKAFEEISNGPRRTTFKASVSQPLLEELSISAANFSCVVKGRKSRRLQYEMYEEMSANRQLGLYDPMSIAWELTPWSFVVDWFVPVGTYLDNLNQIPHLSGRWLINDYCKYEMQSPDWIWKNQNQLSTGNPQVPFADGKSVRIVSHPLMAISSSKMARSVSNSPPAVPLPKLNVGGAIHGRRLWNAISLAHQRFF
jgi:hypothetical protein